MFESTYNLQIIEDNIVMEETSYITGNIKAIIVESDKPTTINIFSDDTNIRILELNNFMGIKYFPIRMLAVDYQGNPFNYQVEEISLLDELKIQVQGLQGANIKIKFRIQD